MLLQSVKIERLRNLQSVHLDDLQALNVFIGTNGSGKTSILEAIHLLATGRSFRTYSPRHYIQHHQKDTVVFAHSHHYRIGLQKLISGEQIMRVNGETITTQGQLAKLLPILVLEPQSTQIIDEGAQPRRQMLDWLMFHVEPQFFDCWQRYMRALRQRNHLLKQQASASELASWTNILADQGAKIHCLREDIVQQWQYAVKDEMANLLPHLDISLDYFAGFQVQDDVRDSLFRQLQQNEHRDRDRGNTQYGVHRADIRLKTPSGDAQAILSRGQKKLLITALKIAQIVLLNRLKKETVVLLDDITAELDDSAQQRLMRRLFQLESQVFLTTLHQSAIQLLLDTVGLPYQLYQVDQGQVSAVLQS